MAGEPLSGACPQEGAGLRNPRGRRDRPVKSGQLWPSFCPQRADPNHPATGPALLTADDCKPDQPGQAALHDLRGGAQHGALSQFPAPPGPRGGAQAVRDPRQSAGPSGAPGQRPGAGPCRSHRTLLSAALCPRAQPARIPQHRPQAGDDAPPHATGQHRSQLLHAQSATLSRQVRAFFQAPTVRYAAQDYNATYFRSGL
jgi:hypothetical protein